MVTFQQSAAMYAAKLKANKKPRKPRKDGHIPYKICPNCYDYNPAAVKVCRGCDRSFK